MARLAGIDLPKEKRVEIGRRAMGNGRREWGILSRKQCMMLQKLGLRLPFG